MRICNCFELLREMKDSREKLQHFHLTLIMPRFVMQLCLVVGVSKKHGCSQYSVLDIKLLLYQVWYKSK